MSFDVRLDDGTIRSYDTYYLEDYADRQPDHNSNHRRTPCGHCECEEGYHWGCDHLECAILTAKHNGPEPGNFLIVTGMFTLVVGFGLLFIILGLILNRTEENSPLIELEAFQDKGTIDGIPAHHVLVC